MWAFARHLMLVTLVLGLVLAASSRRTESRHGLDGLRAQSRAADDARDPFVVAHHLAAARVVGPSVPARAQRAGPLVGIAEQKPTMFASRAWQRLQVVDARYTTPWDTLDDPQQLALLDQWMLAAGRAHVRVLLGFAHSLRNEKLARSLPSARAFERQFKRFRERYPYVRDWLPWNEANNPGAMTASRPKRAAEYFDVVARNCRGCRVVAADVLDTSDMTAWVARFRRYAKHTPRVWGLHNYGDANGFKVKSTLRLLYATRGKIWFTETGGVLVRRDYRGRKVLRTYRYSARHAAQSISHALALSCLSSRIARVYVYHWQAPPTVTNWDSGLTDGRGRVRASYRAVQRWLARSAHASRHGGRRALCRGSR
jgi:hypothetical protein